MIESSTIIIYNDKARRNMTRNILSLDSSILYRSSQKHFDKVFSKYNLGYASALFLTQIYENEGISMNELAMSGDFDKGTITKSIQKLQELGYVTVETSKEDKRQKKLYTTEAAQKILPDIYAKKQTWWDHLLSEINDEELSMYLQTSNKILKKAREYALKDEEDYGIKFFGLQKLTLLDYPGHMAATLFTGGCNFRCPFCHNKGLVFLDEGNTELDIDEIYEFLNERKKILDGICISGGEPLIHKGLKDFIKEVKKLGLKVKLDTNGSFYEGLKELIDENLLDYVAMDVKNSKRRYSETIGVTNFVLDNIEKSIELLKMDKVDYEFRCTVVKEYHDAQAIKEMGEWLKGSKQLYLQGFIDSGHCIKDGLNAHDKKTLEEFRDILCEYIPNTYLRGID